MDRSETHAHEASIGPCSRDPAGARRPKRPGPGPGREVGRGPKAGITIMTADGLSSGSSPRSPGIFRRRTGRPTAVTSCSTGGGKLWRIPRDPRRAPLPKRTGQKINNDHGIAPDGKSVGDLGRPDLRLPPRDRGRTPPGSPTQSPRATSTAGRPTASTLAFVAQRNGGTTSTSSASPPAAATKSRLTSNPGYDDGPDYSPDGKWIYFNSDRSGRLGHLAHARRGAGPDDEKAERVTSDELEDWFPHPSPNGKWMLFLSFPKGTEGSPRRPGRRHPDDADARRPARAPRPRSARWPASSEGRGR